MDASVVKLWGWSEEGGSMEAYRSGKWGSLGHLGLPMGWRGRCGKMWTYIQEMLMGVEKYGSS
jgi:hypothetical protein